jgi:hypothetical protein
LSLTRQSTTLDADHHPHLMYWSLAEEVAGVGEEEEAAGEAVGEVAECLEGLEVAVVGVNSVVTDLVRYKE